MTTNPTHAKPTALETYRARRADVARLLDWLGMELDKLGEKAEAEPVNWGYAGTMGHVRTSLIDLLEGLSGIERERIEETLRE